MDRLEQRLRNLISFMNENSKFRLLAVELDYYRHGDDEIVSPRVFGAEARRPLERSGARGTWSEELFFERLAASASPEALAAVRQVCAFSKPLGEISWGSGAENPSMNPRFVPESSRAPITIKADGRMDLKLSWLQDSRFGPVFNSTVRPLIEAAGLSIEPNHGNGKKTRWPAEEWVPRVDALIAAFRHGLEVAVASQPQRP